MQGTIVTMYWVCDDVLRPLRWLPGRSHAFIVSSATPRGEPYIAYWNGRKRLRVLVHGTPSLKKYYYEPDYKFVFNSLDLQRNILQYHVSQTNRKGSIRLPS